MNITESPGRAMYFCARADARNEPVLQFLRRKKASDGHGARQLFQ